MYVLLASISIPMAAAVAALFVRSWRAGSVVAGGALACSALLLGLAAVAVSEGGRMPVEYYAVAPQQGLLVFEGDGFNLLFALIAAALGAMIAVYSGAYMAKSQSPAAFYSLYLIYVAAMEGTMLSGSLTTFFLFFELSLIPSWALIAYWGGRGSEGAALKYLLFTEAGALITMVGIAVMYDRYGALEFAVLRERLSGVSPSELLLPAALLSIGPLVKMAIFPLHAWLPDAYVEAPTPVTAALSSIMVGLGSWALVKILIYSMPAVLSLQAFRASLMVMAGVTMIYGGVCALVQSDLKRLLAYSSISQMGYVLLGIAGGGQVGIVSTALFYVGQGLAKAALFMIVGYLELEAETRNVDRLGGLARVLPISAIVTLTAFLSLAGVPPLVGFWAELEAFWGALASVAQLHSAVSIAAVVALLASTTITAAYGLWTVKRVFYGKLPEELRLRERYGVVTLAPLILAVLLALLGAWPTCLVRMALLLG